jgi:hypothetical protein
MRSALRLKGGARDKFFIHDATSLAFAAFYLATKG